MNKRVLLIGGAGFAGTGISQRLLEDGYEITILDMTNKAYTSFINSDINYIWKSVQDINKKDVKNHDIILYLAAQADVPMGFTSPKWTITNNIDCLICALELVKDLGCEKFIFAGSGNEIGRPLYIPIDEKHPLTPHNPYAFSKAAQEMACWSYYRAYDIPVTIMSNGMVVGPEMRRDIVIFKWLYNALLGKTIFLEGGDQTRDITYVEDVIEAWILAIKADSKTTTGEKFQVSFGKELSMLQVLDICKKVANVEFRVEQRPYRPGEKGQREVFDNSKARELLGYNPQYPPELSIELTFKWIKETFFNAPKKGGI